MASKKKNVKYQIKVTKNPMYCGIGAGGVQFANGQATIGAGPLVNWFKEHNGYEVTEVEVADSDSTDSQDE